MNRTQHELYKLLIEIDDICSKNNIEYCFGGGCLIGAVRGGKFLPWDDDADIHMTRENIEKFVAISETSFPNNRVLVYSDKYPEHVIPCIYRYENTEHTTIMRGTMLADIPCGQFIDIIVLDDAPTDYNKQVEQLHNMCLFQELYDEKVAASTKYDGSFFNEYFAAKKRMKKAGRDQVLNYYWNKAMSFAPEECSNYIVGSTLPPRPIIPKELFGTFKYIDFEDRKFPVPEKSEELLKYEYGPKWMYAPPVAEENPHTFMTDLDLPYTVLKNDYSRLFEKRNYTKLMIKTKDARFRVAEYQNETNNIIRKIRGVLIRAKTEQLINDSSETLEEIRKNNPAKLGELFKDYLEFQFSTTTKYWNVFERLDDNKLYYALYYLYYFVDYADCAKLISMREQLGELPSNINGLKLICEQVQQSMDYYYVEKDLDSCRALVTKGLSERPNDHYLLRLYLKLLYNDAQESNNYSFIDDETKRVLDIYPNDGEFLIFRALKYEREGKLDDAAVKYAESYRSTRNGYVLNLADERLSDLAKQSKKAMLLWQHSKITNETDADIFLQNNADFLINSSDDTDTNEAISTDVVEESNQQFVYLKLLKEIDAICRENQINYYLIDEALVSSLLDKTIPNTYTHVRIVMLQKDIERFNELVKTQNIKNRVVEEIHNNYDILGYFYRYTATDTTFFDIDAIGIKNPGYAISIFVPIEINEPSANPLVRFISKLYNRIITILVYNKRPTLVRFRNLLSKIKDGALLNILINLVKKKALIDTQKKSKICLTGNKQFVFPNNFFSSVGETLIDGYSFQTVSDVPTYLSIRYSKTIDCVQNIKIPRIQYNVFACPTVPCNVFMALIDKEDLITKELLTKRTKYKINLARFRVLKTKVRNYWNKRDLCGMRYKLWKYYYPRKDEILRLYDAKDYVQLEKELIYYIEELLYFKKLGLGLCFDNDLLRITLDVLTLSENYSFSEEDAESVLSLVPSIHIDECLEMFIKENVYDGFSFVPQKKEWEFF